MPYGNYSNRNILYSGDAQPIALGNPLATLQACDTIAAGSTTIEESASSQIVAARANRTKLTVKMATGNSVYVATGAASSASVWTVDSTSTGTLVLDGYVGALNGRSSSGDETVTYLEEYHS